MFSITCTTCRARLKVRNEEAIGAILECPKCCSMVLVAPPEGWQPEVNPAEDPAGPVESAAVAAGAATSTGPGETPTGPGETAATQPPPLPSPAEPAAAAVPITSAGAGAETLAPAGTWTSPAELLWRKWLLLAGGPVVGLVVLVGVWSIWFTSSRSEPPTPVVEQPAEPPPADQSDPPAEQPDPLPTRFDQRWLPDRTALVLSLQPQRLAELPNSSKLIDQVDPLWRPTVGAVLGSLGLKLGGVARLTWASTHLASWPERSVAVIELQAGHDATVLEVVGEPVDLSVDGAACRRLPDAPWSHPFAILDRRTIITGDAELLRRLPRADGVHLESTAIGRLLKVTAPDADVALLVDLAAVRAAHWKLPSTLMDVWPAGKQPWHEIWEMPEGVGCALHCSDQFRSRLALVCEGDTAAEKVGAALNELVPAAARGLSAQLESLPAKLQAGQMTAATADQYGLLLKGGAAALQAARWEVADGTVFLRIDWGQGPSVLAAAAADSRPAIHADWLAAAGEVDRANYRRLLSGLGGHEKAEGRLPSAAAGGVLLPPETRLSWIAMTLPYFGYPQWNRRLEFGYPWNGPQNRETARQPLPPVINPAVGPSRTEAGFPVTHYVGVAGVGPDAGRRKANDPQAGVFGYGRTTHTNDIADGAANTIAILGVAERLGPWAAGGDSTVRALTKRPYVNGPDGFSSGQPNGMFAGMADGSVRFISKDIDPLVLEQLATIGGRERVTAIALNPAPVPPKPEPGQPDPGPQEPVQPRPAADAPPDGPGIRPAPPQADVEARLADTIPQIELRDTPLAEAVALLAAMSTVPITFDPDAMSQQGVTLRDPVTVRLSGATVRQILETAVSSRGLAAVVDHGQVLVTTPPDQCETLRQRQYTVSDLTGEDPVAVAELAALVQKLVVPDSWRSNGGRGTIEPHPGALFVIQNAVVHHHILVFCEKLRNARGKPFRSRLDPDRFRLATRWDRARRALELPVSVNFHQPTPLVEILAHLGQSAEIDLLIDRLALRAAGLSDLADATLKVRDQPLAAALDELLRPLDLAYRAVDTETLQVTSRKAIDARLELEFYPVAELLNHGRTGPALLEQIKSSLAGSTWSDAGGPGVLYLDQPSNCLIVLQSQPVQTGLQRLLSKWRAEKAVAGR